MEIIARCHIRGEGDFEVEDFALLKFSEPLSPIFYKKILGHAFIMTSWTVVAPAIRKSIEDSGCEDGLTTDTIATIDTRIKDSKANVAISPNKHFKRALDMVASQGDSARVSDLLEAVSTALMAFHSETNFTKLSC
jgi:hypothetical protein